MYKTSANTIAAVGSFPTCKDWQDVNAAGGTELGAVIEGLVHMNFNHWGEVTATCQKELDEVWSPSPKFNIKAVKLSGGYM